MTKHMELKHKVQKTKKTQFNDILEEALLSDNEKRMMRLYYIDKKDLCYIADVLGYSKAGIIRMHKRVLEKIESLL